MAILKSINPYYPSRIVNYPQVSDMNLAVLLGRANAAFKTYRNTSFEQRTAWMNSVASTLRERSREFAGVITREMGKPVTEAEESSVNYQPLGPVLAIMPWNFPFWQVFRFAAPAIMAGNTALLKHASNVQGCAGIIEEIFVEAGFQEGVFQNLSISSDRVAGVISNEYVKAVTLTGSEAAGMAVASEAGRYLKKCVLELGAKLVTGGHRDGAFFEPTVITGVKPGMPVFDEEVFGPVYSIMEVDSPGHALEISNQSKYGLGVQVFTQSESSANLFIEGANEGSVFINAMVRSDPRLPFGGLKNSGFGRELSVEGIREFVNIKTVWID